MSTKERIHALIELIDPADLELFYPLLQRLAFPQEVPNDETIEALLESEAIAHDPNIKGYTNIKDLMEALEEE
ncbi:MAG: hypothetical protein ACI4XB_06035 [Ruminococcus sp.]